MIEAIQEFILAFNNRELAVSIWILLLVIWCISYYKIRKTFFQLVKAFFALKLVYLYILMFTYIGCIILGLKAFGIWKINHIPLTFLWFICVAFVMFFNYQKANDQDYFKKSFKDNVKFLLILEFVVNLYVFNFWVEFILVPAFALIGGVKAIAEGNEKYEIVNKLMNYVLVVTGSFLILYAAYMVVTDFKSFATAKNLESFYIPILLSMLFMPFVYVAALLIAYELFFIRLQFFVSDKSILRYAKLKTILLIHCNLLKLNRWSQYINMNWRFNSKEEVKEAVTAFKQASSSANITGDGMV